MASKDKFYFQKVLGIPDEQLHVIEPVVRLVQALDGKRCLPLDLWRHFNHWIKLSEDKLQKCEAIMEFFYFGVIIMDDIIDSSELRRGIPTTHLAYGVPKTMHLIKYLLLVAIKKIQELQPSERFSECLDELLAFAASHELEARWREDGICPTEEQYLTMARGKCCSKYFVIGIKLMQSLSDDPTTDYSRLAHICGTFLAVYNDYINLCSASYTEKKGFCEDITEGKFSFPVVHAIRTFPTDHRIMNVLKQRPTDNEIKKNCLMLLKEFGSLDYTKKYLECRKGDAIAEIQRLGGNPKLEKVLEQAMLHYETEIFLD